ARRALRGTLLAAAEAWRPRGTLAHGIAALPPDAGPPPGEAGTAVNVPALYRRAQAALAYAFHADWRGAVDADDVLPPVKPIFRLDGEQLFEALQEPEPSAAEALCTDAFRALAADGRCEPKLMKDYAALTLMKLKSRARDMIDSRVGSVVTETAMSAVPACRSAEALTALLLGCLREVHKSLHERKQGRSELIVDQCLSWIHERYAEDLTLEAAAERFHFNASYFSTLLKARTGRSFSEHVTDARIRRAKELLAAGRLRIYEIAEQCGYRDTKYFTRMFKRQVGLSPEAYKHAAPRADESGSTP
ncbi:helix-turn-helix transcriptional regulator, partial [Paenibacillus sp. GCM10023250]|uniref:helix-turn-helix transcriptional regulator n=1 Tax=Paenibacillus sp. GCM10023250 TaxID=3252648 RepID=UPI00360CDA8D